MTLIFRTTDNTKWGVGKGSNLTAAEIDENFYELYSQFLALQDHISAGAGISSFSVSGSNFFVHLTDSTVLGPYPLPVVNWVFKGEWLPNFGYEVNNFFTYGNKLYMVLLAHTSAATFDPGANGGPSQDYYQLILTVPSIPPRNVADHSYTLLASDAESYLRFTHANGCLVFLEPDSVLDVPIGTTIHLRDESVGVGGELIVEALSPCLINRIQGRLNMSLCKGATIGLKKVDTNSWDIFGLLALGSP